MIVRTPALRQNNGAIRTHDALVRRSARAEATADGLGVGPTFAETVLFGRHRGEFCIARFQSVWVVAGPFIWSAISLGYEDIMQLSPDRLSTVAKTKRLLARQSDLLNFFGTERFCASPTRIS
jgi:hypothetical protein